MEEAKKILVVGCTRGPGQVDPSIADIVGQSAADFRHLTSFPGCDVTTCDVGPKRTGPGLASAKHIQGDFLKTTIPPESLDGVSFEWFPSSLGADQPPLLTRAVKRAFRFLKPGALLEMDHHPFVMRLPEKYTEAMGIVDRKFSDQAKIAIARAISEEQKSTLGIVSHVCQAEDPFTTHRSNRENTDICDYLLNAFNVSKGRPSQTVGQLDTATNFACVASVLEKMKRVFPDIAYGEMCGEINNAIFLEDESSTYLNIFEWFYGVESRFHLVKSFLEQLDFENVTLNFHDVNPRNGREWAYFINATKKAVSA